MLWRQQAAQYLHRELVAEQERKALADRLALVMRHANDIIIMADGAGQIVEANDRALRAYGHTLEEMRQKTTADLRAPEFRTEYHQQQTSIESPGGAVYETVHRRSDGTTFPVEISARSVEIGGMRYKLGIIRDITQRQAHEREIERINRLYAALSQVNLALVRVSSRQELFDEVCRVMVEFGRFRLAWIGEHDAARHVVQPVARAGDEQGRRFLEELQITTEASAETQGPTGTAVREGRGDVCNDYVTNPHIMDSWREAAQRAGFNAAAAFPIRFRGEVWGNLTVYVAEAGFFRDKESALLEETAADISFALDRLEDLAERKRALVALRESEERFRSAIEAAPEAIFVQARGCFAYVNPEAVRLFGADSPVPLLGQPVVERFHPDFRDRIRERIRLLNEVRQPVPFMEQIYLRLDGRPVDVLVRAVPFSYQGENGALVFASDITERRRAEAALRESEERFRSVVDAAPEAIYIQTEGLMTYVNPAAVRLYGAESAAQLVGQPLLDRIHPYFRESVRERMRLVREERQTIAPMEQVHLRLDGQPVYLHVAAVPFDLEGQKGSLVFAADFTERHRTEEALRLSQLKFETIFRSALDLNFISDLESGEIVEASDAFCDALGSRETVLGRTMEDLHLWISAAEQANYRKSLLADNGKVHNFAARLRLGSGEQRDFLLSGRTLFFEGKEYVLTIGRDITELRQSERERALLANTLAASLNEIYIFDAETWHFVFVNDSALHNLGYALPQMQWMTPLDLMPDTDRAKFEQSVGLLIRHEKPALVIESRSRRADGSYYPVEVHVQLFESESGRVFLAVIQDITERRRAQEALQESEQCYRELFELESDAVILVDSETHRYVDVNQAAQRLYGYSREEFLQMTPESVSVEPEKTHENIVTSDAHVPVRWHRKKSGERFAVEITANQIIYRGRRTALVALRDITERKRTEEALQESQALYHSFVEQLPNAAFRKDRAGRYVMVNAQFCRLKGMKAEEFLGKTPKEVAREATAGQGEQGPAAKYAGQGEDVHEQIMRTGQLVETEEEYPGPTGGKQYLHVLRMPVFGPDGKVIGTQGIQFDITGRKLAEQKLRDSEYFLRKSQEVSRLGSYQCDFTTDVWVCSSTLDEILGINENYPKNLNGWLELVVAEQRQEIDQYLKQHVVAEHNRFEKEYRIVRPNDRQERWVFGLGELELDENGHTLRMIGTIQDITESKAAAMALRNAKEFAENLIRTANTIIVWLDADGRIMLFNEAAEQVTGYTRAELEEKNWFEVLVPRARYPQVWTEFARLLNGGQPVSFENPVLTKSGEERIIVWQNSEVQEEGRIVGTISFGMDVTDRRRAEEGIRQLNAELEHRVRDRTAALEATNNELEAFSYSVSHDLRAPLRAIDGFTRILVEDHAKALDPEGRRVLDVISKEGQRMGQLIDDLLAFSRLGRRALRPEEVDLTALAREIFKAMAEHEPKRRLKLRLTPLPPAYADPSLIRQVLVNLIDNAVKYTRPRKVAEIQIGGAVQGSENVYYVKDNGAGFDMQYADKLFGVFQRLHSDEEFEGTGVGLALVQRIVRRHGGRVWAEGKVDEGATFFFTLPVHRE
jgi:PAS domain S-box-containing protein